MLDRVFDVLPSADSRNQAYSIAPLLEEKDLVEKIWDLPECLDQGTEGACVAFGWTHELLSEPDRVVGIEPLDLYHRAQDLDEYPPGTSGTSILAGAKVVQELGHLAQYRWAFEITDVLATLSVNGPVVAGLEWYIGMAHTDTDGYIRRTGKKRGMHCVCLIGLVKDDTDVKHGWSVVGKNSWGLDWGDKGLFRMTATDLEKLMPKGDICVPVVRGTPAYELAYNC